MARLRLTFWKWVLILFVAFIVLILLATYTLQPA